MNGLGFVLMGLGLAGAIWCAMNAWDSWRILRRRNLRLVKPRRRGVVVRFVRKVS